jgi:NADH-quinone oxidoreductase subunit E
MAVRRLHAEQPAAFDFTSENSQWAAATVAKYPPGKQASAVIPLLWRAQEQQGWVSEAAMRKVGSMLDMAYVRVLEVATFYTMFQLAPVGTRAHIQVCGTTPCKLRGADALIAACKRRIHAEPHHLNADGTLSWEEVECLGACVNAPMIMVGKDTWEDLDADRFDRVLDAFASGRPLPPGPQVLRQLAAPEGGATTLTDPALADGSRVGNWQAAFDERIATAARAKTEAAKVAAQAAGAPAAAAALLPVAPTPTGAPSGAAKVSMTSGTASGTGGAGAGTGGAGAGTGGTASGAGSGAASGTGGAAGAAAGVLRGAGVAASGLAGAAIGIPGVAAAGQAGGSSALAGTVAAGGARAGLLREPRGGRGDDLSLIWGVAEKLEQRMNGMGIWHFDQIAAWSDDDIAWFEGQIDGFKGRLKRDKWVEQCQKLANGWRPDGTIGERPKG